jgi:uncharacterized membrane protein YedE/YeeE
MTTLIVTFLSGLLFALGLGVSGMTLPSRVTGFLNIFGNWDPSLAFVMGGAVSVYFLAHQIVMRRATPVLAKSFSLPTRRDIDRPLVLGAALFGFGWGLVGFCPGPAITASVTGNEMVLIFLLAMVAGMYAFEVLDVRFAQEPDGGASLVPERRPPAVSGTAAARVQLVEQADENVFSAA